ncbi:hypothetical protein BX616_010072 [Lobosporangium transversale]|uniref:GYF domain-containing protein n=1 Tax=Lobosporangium transversale TaxID=64571 RepID=A0A1Y2G8D8_9FUNG|nr:hypothetical protein BCR41DRAFT_342283 [Lobosporangium transversale]KAF9913411.1 hypothetical protein BX616_010072 [Lobosporangium transversale]ORZ04052.1 hypothetical protein BCR41DRAFT_342283 [Lobosporangium transversale]|eukprot:XP_021876329.1 hypothetical protein BCR41DRAFT_342283 [Lobosporangium transversale]
MSASNNKRSTSEDWQKGNEGPSRSSKRVRFGGGRGREGSIDSLEEIDDSDLLETRKTRRGGVTVVEYGSGGESSDDEAMDLKKKKTPVDEIFTAEGGEAITVEEEEEDMFADPDEIERRKIEKKRKAALSGKGKSKAFDRSEIEGEDLDLNVLDENEFDSEGNPKIEALNMKAELEEGEIDENGNFVRKLDPERFHDVWLEGVSRNEIEAARVAHERKLKQAQTEEKEEAAKAMSKEDIYLELVNILRPSETVIEALQRLGGGKKAGSKGAKNHPKKKGWQKNKAMDEDVPETSVVSPDVEGDKRKKLIEKLTDLSDRMMAMGHFDIYEETYEQIVRLLRKVDIIADDWEVGTPVLKPGEQAQAMLEDDPLFASTVSWEYKWANPSEDQDADEIFGPFSGAEMKSWNDQGFFSQGILARRVGDSTFEPGPSIIFE